MDFRSVFERAYELRQELAVLKEDPSLIVPSILKLVELEITRSAEIMLYLIKEEFRVYVDEDGLMLTERILIEFGLTDASSVQLLRDGVTVEFELLKLHFQQDPLPLLRICKFVTIVIHRLGLKLSKEYYDENIRGSIIGDTDKTSGSGNSSGQETEADSVERSSSSAPESSNKIQRQGLPSFFEILTNAIDTAMPNNPQDLRVDRVFELVRGTAPDIDVDDKDVKKLILQICNEYVYTKVIAKRTRRGRFQIHKMIGGNSGNNE